MSLFSDLKERRLFQIVAGYVAAGWIVVSGVDQLVDRDVLPRVVYLVALAAFVGGFFASLILGWHHGEKGRQRFTTQELALLGLVGLGTLAVSAAIVRNEFAAPPARGLAALGATEDPRRIAVLYFEDRSAEGDLAFLADGLTESLIDELGQIETLHVVSRNGVELFRDTRAAPDSIAKALEVGTLVTGTVQGSAERLRVQVALVNGSNGNQIASQRLERPRGELFELQDELAEEVSRFLRERLGEEVLTIQRRAATESQEAWELAQRANQTVRDAETLAAEGDVGLASRELARADSLYGRAEALDPDWIDPITQRGWLAYRSSRLSGYDRSEVEERIQVGMGHAARALALDPDDPDALELRGTLRYWRYLLNLVSGPEESKRTFDAAEADLRASVAANPEQASAWTSLSHLLTNKEGAIAEAKLAALRSYEADPYLTNANLTVYRLFATSLELEDQIEARNWCETGRARFPEDYRFAECELLLLVPPDDTPDLTGAWDDLERFVELSPPEMAEFNRAKGQMLIAIGLARAELPDSARAVARRARVPTSVDPLREITFFDALVHQWVGDFDEAFRLLGLYLAVNPGQVDGFAADDSWWWEDLRQDPRWAALVGRGT